MGISERKTKDRADRQQRIVAAARKIAEEEGWSAVTIRRLADQIEYSQPVLYSHFGNRGAIVAAVAVEGFEELAKILRSASQSADKRDNLHAVAEAYISFADEQSALYEAMFILPSGLRFAEADTRSELAEAFEALAAVVPQSSDKIETATETLWAALHGLVELERLGRIRPGNRAQRVELLIDAFLCRSGSS
ncbi:TetR family transcriptional regulator (plasmid) [Kozakia baliensis]|uniref:TetR family transcriptional regulator n=1 Tax=Kozakia baliensis TaxID=153496 RepID=A0A1D8UZ22_9PROT|nr:TetR/AcrR family transcriptional regulator [Kozakia baliensis]AOX18866.1 TetR family transcriptional regulator [Kozakia baliensis]